MPPQHSNESEPLVAGNDRYGSTSSSDDEIKLIEIEPPPPSRQSMNVPDKILIKTQSGSFWEDLKQFRPGSLPHSVILALSIGVICGTAAFLYYTCLEIMLEWIWKTLPEQIFGDDDAPYARVMWIPLVGFLMALGVGCTVRFMGEPGDLPYTIKCVHEKAYISMDHVMPMVAASQFSIIGGGSLGPEAPLVAICASLGGFVSRWIFGNTDRNLVRKHTLMGMAGALAAFFGCPLGGSLFAMEVNSRFGIEYFEHTLEAIFCGEVCLIVFRSLAGLPIEPIWDFTVDGMGNSVLNHLKSSSGLEVAYGAVIGLLGAAVASLFAQCHFKVMGCFRSAGLLESTKRAIPRALVGAVVVVALGMVIPHTMFWGEYEIQTLATLSPASSLPHIWPTSGLLNFEMDSAFTATIVGVTKLMAISFTVAGGYRGGYIFPAFASGIAFGRAIYFICPVIPLQLCMLSMAAAINVGLTRTAIATTLILAFLADEPGLMSSILAASLVSLFVTGYMPFIASQSTRSDLQEALFQTEAPVEVDDAETLKEHRRSGSDLSGPLFGTPFSFDRKTVVADV